MSHLPRICPDCDAPPHDFNRREFIKTAGVAAVAAGAAPWWAVAKESAPAKAPESVVKMLHDTLSESQRKQICFAWDHHDPKRGLLRTHVANNWHITEPDINSEFYTKDQRAMIRHIYEGIIQPEWHERIDRQLEDDAGGFGEHQNIAIFGKPDDKFELVITGRHMTLRCDGNSAEHVAFGGPIFYGHAADGFNEKPNHPGNVFWHQALAANKVYQVLDQKQRNTALVQRLPAEDDVAFRGPQAKYPGLPLADMSSDQRELVQRVLEKLIEPYRQDDRQEVVKCLKAQGGLDKCSLAFYREGDVGGDHVWDCWRLEGPAFVWYYRGSPHVHVWVNVADDASVKTNSKPYA